MASSSSVAAAKPSTSASNEILPADEITNQTQNPVTGSDDQNKEKNSCFPNPLKPKHKEQKLPQPTQETVPNLDEDDARKKTETEKEIEAISSMIKADFHTIEKAVERINTHKEVFKGAKEKFKSLIKPEGVVEDAETDAKVLREFKNVVKTLKQQIFNQGKKQHDVQEEKGNLLSQFEEILKAHKQKANEVQLEKKMPNLFADSDFEETLQFKDFKAQYNELDLELKLCLLCFSVFPENVEIKRRVLIYWWIGEGFVPTPKKLPLGKKTKTPEANTDTPQENTNTPEANTDTPQENTNTPQENTNTPEANTDTPQEISNTPEEDTAEHRANQNFKKLLNLGFFEAAEKKPNPKVDVVKMHPFVRSMVNRIAKNAGFFEFDDDGTVNGKYSKSLRACLLSGKTLMEEKKAANKEDQKAFDKEANDRIKSLHAIVNVDEAILDSKHDALSKMTNANVLYLGRWQSSGTHHIEVDDFKILDAKKGNLLDGLQHIKYLKFLSLQGISRITELPKSILKLQNLTILDIRACHNLEKIPDDIGRLVKLTHLDMSECYLLDEMPKGISKLTNLQVLSGFVILASANKKSCTLNDLKGFPYLRKLSIHTGLDKFPEEKDLKTLNQFQKLSKLTIEWGRASTNTKRELGLDKPPSKNENSGGVANVADTSNQDNVQTSKNENSGKVTNEADTSNRGNVQTSKKENSGEITKEADTGSHDNDQTSKEVNSGAITKEAETGSHDNDQTSKKVNSGAITEKTDTVNQGNDQTSKKENSREITKKADMVNNGNDPENTQEKKCPKKIKGPLDYSLKNLFSKRKPPTDNDGVAAELPSQLTKLDLRCLPETTENWLMPEKLLKLKKLYIRGGKLSDLGQYHDLDHDSEKKTWGEVTELRLKYLDEVEMEWKELLELFPKLDYLEKVDCPKLSFFPCNEIGVWKKKNS